jgi:ribosome recycling factor
VALNRATQSPFSARGSSWWYVDWHGALTHVLYGLRYNGGVMKEILDDTKSRMQKALEALEHHLSVLRTGRANPGMLQKITVDYYGSQMPIHQVANITTPDARTLVVAAFDRSSLAGIEKAIRDSDLGLNPANKGDALYITIPALTEERRKDLVKNAHKYAEEAKVAIRNVRQDANKAIKQLEKDKLATQDDVKRGEADVQKITDEHIQKAEKILETKESEILGS